MNLRSINLNLLKTLHVLLQTRSVTVASKELFLTQPAVSTSLKQLREIFDDKLFIKGEDGLFELTHKAKLIKPKLEILLKQTENLIGLDSETIDPKKCDETFHIATHGHVDAIVFPKLYEVLKEIAPLVKVKQVYITDLTELSAKELQKFDFIIGSFKTIPKNYQREDFFSDAFVCVSGVKSINSKDSITIRDLNDHQHVVLSYMNNYTQSYSEKMLVSHGIKREYKMIVSDASLAIQLASLESLLLILMKKRAEFFTKTCALKIFPLPFSTPELKTEILYKDTDADNPVKQWFKSALQSLIK